MFGLFHVKPTYKKIQILDFLNEDEAIGIYTLDIEHKFPIGNIAFNNKLIYIKNDNSYSIGADVEYSEGYFLIWYGVRAYDLARPFLVMNNISSEEFNNISNSNNPILEAIKLYCQKTEQNINEIIQLQDCNIKLID